MTEHEEAGEWARNVFLAVAVLEIGALALGARPARRWVLVASAVVGVAGAGAVYKASELGGQLVYKYAGGVGTRYRDSSDVQRLLLAGLYQQAMQDRAAKRPDAAAQTVELMSQRFPGDPNVAVLRAESQVLDLKDGKAALATLAQISVPPDNRVLNSRIAFLKADAYLAAGFKDSARVTLEALSQAFPNNPRIKQRLEQLKP